jgi:amino acid transporter
MTDQPDHPNTADDEKTLQSLGYKQELHRGMSAFSNFAISLSIICILAGGITSFHVGLCSVGGASIGLGWPLATLFALVVAATMGQVASAFPTAGGLYHWAAILGGRGWGWATAWFNLAGLITVLAAINVGAYNFILNGLGYDREKVGVVVQTIVVLLITASQALVNHRGIRVTTRLTDFSGYWILAVAVAFTATMTAHAPSFDFSRLVTFTNFSGLPEGPEPVLPAQSNVAWLFLLGLLLPMYTLTGFDASAHTSEETVGAARAVPRGIVRSVLVSGIFGWVMLCTIVLAAPDLRAAAESGPKAFFTIVNGVVSRWLAVILYVGIAAAQYLCGLATVTSASRMAFAFARDGGLPYSRHLRWVSPVYRTPVFAIWTVALFSVFFTIYTPLYDTIAATCTIFLYISYVLPTALGLMAYGRIWTRMGPWQLGPLYRPLALVCILGCGLLFVIGVQPPNDRALWTVLGMTTAIVIVWFGHQRTRFPGPPAVDVMFSRERSASADPSARRTLAAKQEYGDPQ